MIAPKYKIGDVVIINFNSYKQYIITNAEFDDVRNIWKYDIDNLQFMESEIIGKVEDIQWEEEAKEFEEEYICNSKLVYLDEDIFGREIDRYMKNKTIPKGLIESGVVKVTEEKLHDGENKDNDCIISADIDKGEELKSYWMLAKVNKETSTN